MSDFKEYVKYKNNIMYIFFLIYNYFILECIVLINKMENGNVEDYFNIECFI